MQPTSTTTKRLAILVGGGPAPGINGVIAAATTEALRRGLEVTGIYDAFKWLSRGDTSRVRPLTFHDAEQARFRGGSILRTSRENPTKEDEMMRNVVQALKTLGIQHLVTIGGDDTAFTACRISEYDQKGIKVAHVPKTIDNDLPLPKNIPTFGFRTACHVGGQLIKNLVEDARTTGRWYVVVTMGRSAGHLALGMGTAGGAALTLIPEEFLPAKVTVNGIGDIIEGAVFKARTLGQDHGVAVIAEGMGELMQDDLENHLLVRNNPLVEFLRDDHKHLRLEGIPLALILKKSLQQRARDRQDNVAFVDVNIGYEVRCADPIAFDVEYVQQLGWGVVDYLLEPGQKGWPEHGALISIQEGALVPIPFSKMIDRATEKTKIRRVNLDSDHYRSARAAMIRLERSDFEDPEQVGRLAAAANLDPEEFRRRYAYSFCSGRSGG